MAIGLCVAPRAGRSFRAGRDPFVFPRPASCLISSGSVFAGGHRRFLPVRERVRMKVTVCVFTEEKGQGIEASEGVLSEGEVSSAPQISVRVSEKLARKRSERYTYLVAAVMSSFGITSMAVAAVYYRFWWQMEGGVVPVSEMFGTFALSVGAAVGMEFWARWAHRALWHASLWHMHEGLGITVFGMAYMFVHDGLVHRRFPVGPIADVPYFRKVAAAHQIHHSDKFKGVPYGLFLGPKELEEVGGAEELEKEINRRIKISKGL